MRGPFIERELAATAARSVELDATPFFPQRDHQCGPAALATALGASGVAVSPDDLTPLVYLPDRRGSLQLEMQAAPRRYARLAYPLSPNLDALLAELNAKRPVLVLHNYGVPLWPRWHYAVVVGYDAKQDLLIMRSGTTRRETMSARRFMLAWYGARRWALVLLKPDELPENPEADIYLEAAAAFEHSANANDARLAFDVAITAWPGNSIAWIGRGTAAYRGGDVRAAAQDYAKALQLDPLNVGARNNLTMTLLELNCTTQARAAFASLEAEKLPLTLQAAVADTRERLSRSASDLATQDPAKCDVLH